MWSARSIVAAVACAGAACAPFGFWDDPVPALDDGPAARGAGGARDDDDGDEIEPLSWSSEHIDACGDAFECMFDAPRVIVDADGVTHVGYTAWRDGDEILYARRAPGATFALERLRGDAYRGWSGFDLASDHGDALFCGALGGRDPWTGAYTWRAAVARRSTGWAPEDVFASTERSVDTTSVRVGADGAVRVGIVTSDEPERLAASFTIHTGFTGEGGFSTGATLTGAPLTNASARFELDDALVPHVVRDGADFALRDGAWTSEPIVDGGDAALAVHGWASVDGTTHVALGALYASKRANAAWAVEPLAGLAVPAQDAYVLAFTVDDAGRPHIAYVDVSTGRDAPLALFHAVRADGAWHSDVVADDLGDINGIAMAARDDEVTLLVLGLPDVRVLTGR